MQIPNDGIARGGGGPDRVLRGGCWLNSAGNVRAAYRDWYGLTLADGSLGFRVCLARSSR